MARLSQRWQESHEQVGEGEASIARQIEHLPKEMYTEALPRALAAAAMACLGENWEGVLATLTALRQKVERAVGDAGTAR
jgi:hypothetical protein